MQQYWVLVKCRTPTVSTNSNLKLDVRFPKLYYMSLITSCTQILKRQELSINLKFITNDFLRTEKMKLSKIMVDNWASYFLKCWLLNNHIHSLTVIVLPVRVSTLTYYIDAI